jgi:hypothetical protein
VQYRTKEFPMPDIMSSLGPILTPALTAAQVGSTGYNLYNQYQNQQYQNTLRSDAQNPAKVTALAQGYTQPLNAGLTAAVNNQTQAQLAQAGLSESPQISQQVESQAIAPYIQQNQQQGYNDAIQALGLGGGAIPPGQQQQNGISSLAKAFSQLPGQQNLSGASALTRLLQLANAGSYGTPSPTTNPTLTDPGATNIPYQPTDATLDLSSFYQPDYATAGGGGSAPYADSD